MKFISLFIVLLISCNTKNNIITLKLTTAQQLEDLIVLKHILQKAHPGLYEYITQEEFNKQFIIIEKGIKKEQSIIDFSNSLMGIINRIGCSHTDMYLPNELVDTLHGLKQFFPIPLIYTNDSLIVNSNEFNIPLGSAIISINSVYYKDILNKLKLYQQVDDNITSQAKTYVAEEFANTYFRHYGPFNKFNISYLSPDSVPESHTEIINAETFREAQNYTDYYFFDQKPDYDMEIYNSNTAYMAVRTFGYDEFALKNGFNHFVENSFRLLKKEGIKNLIIDIRDNTGGNYDQMFELITYLTQKPIFTEFKMARTAFKKIPETSYLDSTFKADYTKSIEDYIDSNFKKAYNGFWYSKNIPAREWKQSPYNFKGKVFLVINPKVSSAASMFASLLKDEERAVMVGEETGASPIENNSFDFIEYILPNSKLNINIPLVHVKFNTTNIKPFKNHGLMPLHIVPTTSADIIDNKDPQLSYILDVLIK